MQNFDFRNHMFLYTFSYEWNWYQNWPWKRNIPIRLMNNPAPPTIRIRSGFSNDSGSTKRFNASTKIEKHKATRKTAFTKAPKTSARAQPNVLLFSTLALLEYWKQKKFVKELNDLKHKWWIAQIVASRSPLEPWRA